MRWRLQILLRGNFVFAMIGGDSNDDVTTLQTAATRLCDVKFVFIYHVVLWWSAIYVWYLQTLCSNLLLNGLFRLVLHVDEEYLDILQPLRRNGIVPNRLI